MNATTELHVEDIKKFLAILQKLVNIGNTVVVEHNLDVIKCADWVIDLGPEGDWRVNRSWQKDDRNRWRRWRRLIRDGSSPMC